MRVVASFGADKGDGRPFLARYALRASMALLFCLIIDVVMGLAIVLQIPGYQEIASAVATSLTLLVGSFYLRESISFFNLVGSILKYASKRGSQNSKSMQRMSSIARLFFYDAIAMILLAVVLISAIPLGPALWSLTWWPVWWGLFLILRWSISAIQVMTCIMHGNIIPGEYTHTAYRKGSVAPSSVVLPSTAKASSEELGYSSD